MSETGRYRVTKYLLLFNLFFWLFAAFYSAILSEGTNTHVLIKVLLFLEPALYFVCYLGLLKRQRLIVLFALLFTLGNALLSITDEVGGLDALSLILSLAAFAALLSLWRPLLAANDNTSKIA